MNRAADIAGGLILVALVTTLVSHPQTANVVRSFGGVATNGLLAAQGIRPKGF